MALEFEDFVTGLTEETTPAFTVTINFANDAMNARIRNAFASAYGYQDTINGSPNPESKARFRARKIKEYIKEVTRSVERAEAVAAVPVTTVED